VGISKKTRGRGWFNTPGLGGTESLSRDVIQLSRVKGREGWGRRLTAGVERTLIPARRNWKIRNAKNKRHGV